MQGKGPHDYGGIDRACDSVVQFLRSVSTTPLTVFRLQPNATVRFAPPEKPLPERRARIGSIADPSRRWPAGRAAGTLRIAQQNMQRLSATDLYLYQLPVAHQRQQQHARMQRKHPAQ